MAGELLCNTASRDLFQRRSKSVPRAFQERSKCAVAPSVRRDGDAIAREPIMTIHQPEPNDVARRAVISAIHEHWVLFLVEGIVLALLGVAAIVLPVIATL